VHARDTIRIEAPVDEVDRLALPPDAWSRYFVGMSEPEGISGDGGPGTTVEFRMSPPGGRPFHATCRVVEWAHLPDGTVRWRGEFSGGNSGWETWDLRPEDGGTLVTEEMEVIPTGGALVRLAANLFVQRPLRRNVHQSLENLKRLVESH
jgi:uncharacterized protein YndB with AHSA1/START domain